MTAYHEQGILELGRSLRFQNWYSALAPVLNDVSTNTCNGTLASYLAEPWSDGRCDAHLDCMLQNLPESLKAKFASAAVFLGILPSMLSFFSPSLAHLTLLSARRPFLALCVACGNPGFHIDRLFTAETPIEVFEQYGESRFIPRVRHPGLVVLINAFEYFLAGAAVFNVVTLSLRIGDRAIMSFECRIWFLPIIWMGIFVVAFLIVAVPFQFSAVAAYMRSCDGKWTDKRGRQVIEEDGTICWIGGSNRWNGDQSSRSALQSKSFFVRYLTREFTPGPRQASLDARQIPEWERWMSSSLNFGYLAVSFHVILGTCWFSSTLFLSPKDAISIIMRYFGSAVACRLIIAVELAGLKERPAKTPS